MNKTVNKTEADKQKEMRVKIVKEAGIKISDCNSAVSNACYKAVEILEGIYSAEVCKRYEERIAKAYNEIDKILVGCAHDCYVYGKVSDAMDW